jgi:hypothetical protein
LVTPIVPTPSLHTLQLIGLSISKAYSSLLCNATHTFQLHPTAPTLTSTLSSLWKILPPSYSKPNTDYRIDRGLRTS